MLFPCRRSLWYLYRMGLYQSSRYFNHWWVGQYKYGRSKCRNILCQRCDTFPHKHVTVKWEDFLLKITTEYPMFGMIPVMLGWNEQSNLPHAKIYNRIIFVWSRVKSAEQNLSHKNIWYGFGYAGTLQNIYGENDLNQGLTNERMYEPIVDCWKTVTA